MHVRIRQRGSPIKTGRAQTVLESAISPARGLLVERKVAACRRYETES
jgi:hypothetical protein